MENIRTMEWLEHIRLRASMYIGRIGNGDSPYDGIYTILKEIIMNSIDEHQAGFGSSVRIPASKFLVLALFIPMPAPVRFASSSRKVPFRTEYPSFLQHPLP